MTIKMIYYLEMTSASDLIEHKPSENLIIKECEIKQFQVNRFMYDLVGKKWQWFDKNSWTDQQWIDYSESNKLRTWIAYYKGSPAGYFELMEMENNTIEIAYFGLAPNFIGKGLGGYLLYLAIKTAWKYQGANRLIVNTCTLDHPNALKNYQARGMKIYDTKPLHSPT